MGSGKKKSRTSDGPVRTPSQSRNDADRLHRLQVEREAEDAAAAVEAAGRKRQASRTLSGLSPERPTGTVPAPEQPAAGSRPPVPPPSGPPAGSSSAASASKGPSAPSAGPAAPAAADLAAVLVKINDRLDAIDRKLGDSSAAQRKAQDSIDALLERAEKAEGEAAALKTRVQTLEAAVARADQRCENLDRVQRASNMVFFGVASAPQEDLVETTHAHLHGVGCGAAERIVSAVRLGPARAPAGASPASGRPGPVRVTMASSDDVYNVFKSCRALREQRKVYVDRDLTPQQRDTRASLQGEYKQLRENNYRPFWRGERLFYASARGSRPQEVRPGTEVPSAPPSPQGPA